ncbi:MAG: hypothetical protein GX102_07825, partial [Porphyromonadaceae bacterium]|nr:hypothetical protein [Porphyromonadaceae bacterium]
MALLAEEIVEEWLNRQGYFTIRGVGIGVHEIDLLALRACENIVECRHIEVTASIRPMSYITDLPKEICKRTGRSPKSAKQRATEELKLGVNEWIEKKFNLPKKRMLRQKLYPGIWSCELVVHEVLHPEELDFFREAGIKVFSLRDVVAELSNKEN